MPSLLSTVVPLALLGAISPVVFVNATTIRSTQGTGATWRFIAGNALVLIVIGAAGAGILGAGLASLIARELASRAVDGVLGVVLIGYGLSLAWQKRRSSEPGASGAAAQRHDPLAFGAIGMITNYTTLPMFLGATQRIGGAGEPFLVKIALLAAVVVVTIAPAWLPLALEPLAGRVDRHPHPAAHPSRLRAVFSRFGPWISIGACLVGGAVLIAHAGGLA